MTDFDQTQLWKQINECLDRLCGKTVIEQLCDNGHNEILAQVQLLSPPADPVYHTERSIPACCDQPARCHEENGRSQARALIRVHAELRWYSLPVACDRVSVHAEGLLGGVPEPAACQPGGS